MKNKKGFTLIELLVVLALLSVIMIIAFPNFSSISSRARNNIDSSTKVLIKSAAKIYVDNFQEDVDEYLSSNSFMCLPVGKLVAYELIDGDIKDGNGNPINPRKCVIISKSTSNGKTEYNIAASLTTQISNGVDYKPPIIYITPTAANTNESIMSCTQVMTTTYENFTANCEVKVKDDKDGSITLDEVKRYDMKNDNDETTKILLEYNATDVSGNKAIPFKVQLNLN